MTIQQMSSELHLLDFMYGLLKKAQNFLILFYNKTKTKLKDLQSLYNWIILPKMNLGHALEIGNLENGNTMLKLRKHNSLGGKNKIIQLPKDYIIFEHIKRSGKWELETSRFIADGLIEIDDLGSATLIDLGANTGLVTLQALNLAKTKVNAILVEPLENHVEAIKYNLREVALENKIQIYPFALGDKNGVEILYSDKTNFGNSTLNRDVISHENVTSCKVIVKKSSDFFSKSIPDGNYIIKSDLQGHDSVVLSAISSKMWEKTHRLTVEIWATPDISENDVQKLLYNWKCFRKASWSTNLSQNIRLEQVADFWLNKTNGSRNLFLTK